MYILGNGLDSEFLPLPCLYTVEEIFLCIHTVQVLQVCMSNKFSSNLFNS